MSALRGVPSALVLAAVLGVTAACQRQPPPGPDVAARLGESEVPYTRFEAYLGRAGGNTGEGGNLFASDVLSQLFDQFLEEEMLVRLAADRGLVRAGSAGRAAPPRRAIDALLRAGSEAEPDEANEAEIARYYQSHRREFVRPERVRLRQILTEDKRAAERAARDLAAGADFAELARRVSRDPSAGSGGYQGELSRRDLPPGFADLIFGLKEGEASRVVSADYGYHIFQVTQRLPAEVAPLAEVRGEIRERLRRERTDRLLGSLVREARSRYHVEVYERNLPFHYEGSYSGIQKQKKS